MLRGRLALTRVYLCLVCLLCVTPPPAISRPPCTDDIPRKVQQLLDKAPNVKLDCRLYTPSVEDYRRCPRSTLNCFAGEIKVLIDEWVTVGVPKLRGSRLHSRLETLALKLNQTTTESECLRCELLKEEEAETFLKSLNLTLKMVNSDLCHS